MSNTDSTDHKNVFKVLLDIGWISVDEGSFELIRDDVFGFGESAIRFKSEGETIILPSVSLNAVKLRP